MSLAAWCFQCGLEYDPEVAECVECAVPTVGHFPTPAHQVGGPNDDQMAYELHSWTGAQRAEVSNLLYRANVSHGWQGPTLIVLVSDEEAVDDVIDQVSGEDDGGNDSDGLGSDATDFQGEVFEGVDPGEGMVAIPVGASTDLQEELLGILNEDGIDHDLKTNGFLLVPAQHEDQVSELFEELQAKYRAADSFGEGVEGVNAHDVVDELFLTSSTLRKSTRDVRAGRKFVAAADLAHQLKLPFGFEAPMWRSVLQQSSDLADLIADGGDDDDIEAQANTLRDLLHKYV